MPVRSQVVEELTELAQRYCAVENGDEEPQDGYFSLCQGKNQRHCKQARAPIKFGDFTRTAAMLLKRVTELSTNGEGHVYVKVFETGSSSPLEVLKVEGTVDGLATDDEDIGSDTAAVPALVGGLLRMVNVVVAENREHRDRQFRTLDDALVQREQLTMSLMHNQLLESQGEDQRMAAAIQALGPTIEAVTPAVVAAVERWASGRSGPVALPDEPGARVEALVAQMVAAAECLGGIARSPHAAMITPQRAANLYILVRQLAPFLGLTVTGYPEPPPAEPASESA